jgi:hypothetical protein
MIALTGLKGSGKSTVAAMIRSKWNFPEYTFAGPIKSICEIAFLLDHQQLEDPILKEQIDPRWGISPRVMFQKLGTECFRHHFGATHWLQHMQARLQREGCPFVIVSDTRFANEAQFVKDHGGILIRIVRDTSSSNDDGHVSEAGQAALVPDIVVQNSGTLEELEAQVGELMNVVSARAQAARGSGQQDDNTIEEK